LIYKTVGKTGIKVSGLCLGTLSFGEESEDKIYFEMFSKCRELGINFFDTANTYANGRSEAVLGKCVASCRDEVVLATKLANPTSDNVNDRGLSRRNIMLAVEESLRKLKTDRIDFYFCHKLDPFTDVEETLKALDDLQRQGKILYPAVSNWAAWQIVKALGISERKGLARFECIQPMYNLVKRQAETEILPMALEEKVGVTTYGPLAGGLLTGKYAAGEKKKGRLSESEMYKKRYSNGRNYTIAEKFARYAESKGFHPVTLAVAWVMSHPAVTAPIIGGRNFEQLRPSLAALDVEMTEEWRDEISSFSIQPASPTDRSEEL